MIILLNKFLLSNYLCWSHFCTWRRNKIKL